jgi:pimeloyl-ACP methyl ester carboxylesterase
MSPYLSINGLELYFEVHGDGRPLAMLHGGLMTFDLTFGPLVAPLADGRQVIGVELQGHGHTSDIDRPMRLESLTDDVAALIDHLGFPSADLLGFSLGGMVALTLALRHRARVAKLVVASVDPRPSHDEASHPEDPDVMRRMPTEADFAAMRQAFVDASPHPGDFEKVAEKTGGMVHSCAGWSDEELRSVTAPTLVLVGDTDFVPIANAVAMFELIPNAELAVLPHTTHMGMAQSPERVLSMIGPFLGSAV